MDYYDRVKELEELSSYNESEPYEVDMGGIYWDPSAKKYCFITASGCSCWDGGYDESQYDKLSELLVAEQVGPTAYSPSLSTMERMAEEATLKALEMGLSEVGGGISGDDGGTFDKCHK